MASQPETTSDKKWLGNGLPVVVTLILALAAVVALVAMLAFPAHADVSGPACVTDGDTLVVNGKRERSRCVGGSRRAPCCR